jgi:hypothetical protein
MMHVGNDTTEESRWTIRRTKKLHGVVEHIEKHFQKYFVPGKNIAVDESTVGFKAKIILKTYNPKKQQNGASDYLCDSGTGCVHSVILYYRKLTGDMRN